MKKKSTKRTAMIEAVTANRKRLLTNDTPFAIKEAYVRLRTNLMFCMTADKHRPCKVFAVTSAKPAEGKSLTAANIAISFAMLGRKTLLIDADMRKPTQRRLWHVEVSTGLCDFLAKIWPLELAQVESIPLTIVCTGTIPPNPSEVLTSDRMKQFVDACAKSYDYVIIDTPPINTVADAQIVSTFVDGVILVAKSGSTTSDELNEAIDTVHRAGGNLCGVVLNELNMKSIKYAYRYRYGDKYGYKYTYADTYEA
ncbi:MAG: CpsD/CapB family tyrosine-protein kinase [Eubacteriales bacterium]